MSRVLVVDDEEAYRTLMAGHLERKGLDVATAGDGPSAVEVIERDGPFDVVVTDLMMPEMSGLDLLQAIKDRDPATEVIMITASNEVSKAIAAMREGGAYDYLLKPLESINELSLTVVRAIQHRELLQEQQRLHAELDREASRLQALVTYSSEAMLLADAQGVIEVANPAAQELLGTEDLEDSVAAEALPPELYSLIEAWRKMGGQAPSVVEVNWPTSATHLVSIAPVGNPELQQTGWVMILREISHLKQIDEYKLRMLNDAANRIRLPLAQAISKLADLSTGAIQEEEARNATIYQLTTILGQIQDWMDEMQSLVQVEAGIGFSSELLPLREVLNENLKSEFEDGYGQKGVSLRIDVLKELPNIRVDPKLFRRMLMGILDRAAQRTQVGGEITLNTHMHEDQVWIEVSDQGIPSQSAEGMDDRWASSSGFGLQMVRAIVQKLGGQVWIRGHDGVGSTIAISLPTAE